MKGTLNDFWKPAIRLGFPVALQSLLTSSAGMVDTLMIGTLGDIPVAAVGMAAQWSWLMHIFFYGVSSGAAVFISQFWGAKDEKGIGHAYGILLLALLAISLLMAAVAFLFPGFAIGIYSSDPSAIRVGGEYLRYASLSYIALAFSQAFSTLLRSTEQVRIPLYGSIVSVLGNIVLNYCLIFGKFGFPEMGVAGAALATSISAWMGMLTVLLLSRVQKNILFRPIQSLFSFKKAFAKQYIRISTPVLFNEILWALGQVGYNMIYGRLGTLQFAAITIFRTVDGLFFSFYIGLCHACAVLVGREIGAGRIKEAIRFANRFTVAMPALSVVLGAIVIASRGLLVSLFDVSEEVRRMAMAIMLLFALNIPIRNIPYVTICGIFRPGGDTRTGLRYDLLTVWFLALPATLLAGFVLRLDFIVVYAIMLICEDWPKTVLCLRRLRSLAWIQPVVGAHGKERLSALPDPAEGG